MKRLILVRHAKTEPLTDAESDFKRQLKKRGHKDSRLISDHLIGSQIVPGVIISSPATRAYQTACIMAGAFSIPESEIKKAPFIYHGIDANRLIEEIDKMAGDEDSVMVVGHNPDIAMMASRLSGNDFFDYPTSATVVMNFPVSKWSEVKAGTGEVELFLYPKKLKRKK